MKRLLSALLLLTTPLVASAQEPSTVAALDAPAGPPQRVDPGELPARLPTIFTAEIISTRTRPPAPGARLLTTDVELALRTCVRGECPQRTVVVVPGGRFGDIEQWVEDLPPPRQGAVVAVTLPAAVDESGDAPPLRRFARLLELTPPPGAATRSRLQSPPVRGSNPTREVPRTPHPRR